MIDYKLNHPMYKLQTYLLKQNIYNKEDYFDKMPDYIFEELKKIMGWHLCISCNKNNFLNETFTENIYNTPWKHIEITNLFNENFITDASLEIPEFNDKYWDNAKHFINEYTDKKEINNIEAKKRREMESNFGKKIDKMKNEKLFVSIILRDKY